MMTVIFEPKETTYDGRPDWQRRIVFAYSPYTHNGKERKSDEFTIEKSQYDVDISFQTHEGDFSRSFTHEEFEEFIKQCQWVSQCKVAERKAETE
jgi:hypothetical protein